MMDTGSKHVGWLLLISSLFLSGGCAHKPKISNPADAEAQAGNPTGHPKPEIYRNIPPLIELSPPVHLQTGRYTYVPAKPKAEQLNPLLTLIDVHIPDPILTVKESAQYLLQFSGYTLTQLNQPEAEVTALMHRPIPEVHRHFEAVILRDALLTLAGNGYRLMVDPVHRSVAYARDPVYPGRVTP